VDTRGRVGRNLPPGVDLDTLQIRLSPANDELLSTYLVRRAHRQGLSPHMFMQRGLPRVAIWNRDIDCSASAKVLSSIAHYCHLSEPEVKAMTLYDLVGCSSPAVAQWRHYQSWINAVGVYHRLRRRMGLQYCPLCLRDDDVFRRIWRLAFVFCCPEHGVLLRECCPSCEAPVIPHRARIDMRRCWNCGAVLSAGHIVDGAIASLALETQTRMMRWFRSDDIFIGGEMVSRFDCLRGEIRILRVVKQHVLSHPALWSVDLPTDWIHDQIRFLGRSARQALFSLLLEIMDEWPSNFLQFAMVSGVSRLAFRRECCAPQWLENVLEQLPARLRSRRGPDEVSFVRYIRRLENTGGVKCRALRAEALMLAAKGKYGH